MKKVLLCYKNFSANANISHIGLGVSALNTAKVLKRHNVAVGVLAINSVGDLDTYLQSHPDITHVVISAAWIPTLDLGRVIIKYPDVEFCTNIHSGVGFLHADVSGVRLIREYVDLAREILNFSVSGNSLRFVDWVTKAYSVEAIFLPNLYDLDSTTMVNKPLYNGGTLRIGAFGAGRPQKNFMSAAGAVLCIAKDLGVMIDFYMSGGRPDGGGGIARSITEMFEGSTRVNLHVFNWVSWPRFLDFVETMNLMMQPSYTESMNLVTADGIARGVPSVVSPAISWTPDYWQADSDDANQIAQVGESLITNPHAVVDGVMALERHNKNGFHAWLDFMSVSPVNFQSAVTTGKIR